MTRLFSRAQEIFQERGLWATLVMAFRKLVSPVAQIGSVYFFECDLRAPLPRVREIPGIIPREAFLADIDLLDGTENAAARKADGIDRFKRGDRWFVGIDAANGKLTNYRWVTTTWELIPELQRNIMPKPGEAFVYALYTVPEYRRRGIDSFTRQYTYDVLYRNYGITRVLATIFDDNKTSLIASRKFLTKIDRVWYITIRGFHTRIFVAPNPGMPTLAPAFPTRETDLQNISKLDESCISNPRSEISNWTGDAPRGGSGSPI
jgi:GNAT superfamily N-acetyltransferase